MMATKLSQQLKKIRMKNNLNQRQLAEIINVSQNSVSSWESGNKFPSQINLQKINKILGFSIDLESEKHKESNNKTLSFDGLKQRKINTHDIGLMIDTVKMLYNRNSNDKISKSDLAKQIGLNPQAFSQRFNGKVPWKISELKKLAKRLNLPSYFLIFGPVDPNHAPKVSKSEIFKQYDSNGKPFYLVKEILSNENHLDKNNTEILKMKQSIRTMMIKLEKLEAQND